MRSLREFTFSVAACVSLIMACEPDLDPLSAEWGQSGGSGGGSGMGGGISGGRAQGGGEQGGTAQGGNGTSGETASGGGTEPPDTCSDLRRNANESDVDCGGTSLCDRCELDARCTKNTDCQTDLCVRGRCSEPSCTDAVQNQNETGVDCGGACAPTARCETGAGCVLNSDCISEFCSEQVCTDHCVSKRKDSSETDVDCGGADCAACANGQACLVVGDCESGVCLNNECVAPSCNDDVQNQDESDRDCGGVCRATQPCGTGDKCNEPSDCASYICTSNRCVADIVVAAADMIDNFEDSNLVIGKTSGRVGNWYRFGDGTGTASVVIAAPDRGDSQFAMHYKGGGHVTWGSGIGFDFNNTGTSDATRKPWNATGYSGVTFWARSEEAVSVKFQIPDRNTHFSGGVCIKRTDGQPDGCDHHWYKAMTVVGDWKRYTILFEELIEEPGSDPPVTTFDVTGLVAFQAFFATGTEFDFWIDDVAFIR